MGTMGVVAPIAASGVIVPVLIGLVQRRLARRCSSSSGSRLAIVGRDPRVRPGAASRGGDDGPGPTTAQARAVVLAVVAAVGFGLVLWFLAKAGQLLGADDPRHPARRHPAHPGHRRAADRRAAVGTSGHLRPDAIRDPHTAMRTRDLPALGAVGLGDALANAAFAQASTGGLLSIVSVLGSLYPVATLLLARFVPQGTAACGPARGRQRRAAGVVLIGAGWRHRLTGDG